MHLMHILRNVMIQLALEYKSSTIEPRLTQTASRSGLVFHTMLHSSYDMNSDHMAWGHCLWRCMLLSCHVANKLTRLSSDCWLPDCF